MPAQVSKRSTSATLMSQSVLPAPRVSEHDTCNTFVGDSDSAHGGSASIVLHPRIACNSDLFSAATKWNNCLGTLLIERHANETQRPSVRGILQVQEAAAQVQGRAAALREVAPILKGLRCLPARCHVARTKQRQVT